MHHEALAKGTYNQAHHIGIEQSLQKLSTQKSIEALKHTHEGSHLLHIGALKCLLLVHIINIKACLTYIQ